MRALTRRQEQTLSEMPNKVRKYLELKAQMEELKKQMEELKDEILVDMDRLAVKNLEVELDEGKVKVAKVEYKYEQIDKETLKERYPEIYQEVRVVKDIMRIDIRRVKGKENNEVSSLDVSRVGAVVRANR